LYDATGQQEQARAELSMAVEMYRGMEMTFWFVSGDQKLYVNGQGKIVVSDHGGAIRTTRQWLTATFLESTGDGRQALRLPPSLGAAGQQRASLL